MRRDISKVLVTTARYGSSMKNPEVKALRRERIDEDYDGPGQTSMRPVTDGWDDRKQLNEYLNPLVRYLAASVGRPWDVVYSDICQNNSRGSAVGEHIYQHLFDYVTVSRGEQEVNDSLPWRVSSRYQWHVDGDGILQKTPYKPWGSKPEDTSHWLRRVEDTDVYHVRRNDGCWFELRFRPVEFAFERRITGFQGDLPQRHRHIRVLRTLSRAEKAELGLV